MTTIATVAGTRVYTATTTGTRKHVENPDTPRVNLCGSSVDLYGRDTTRAHRWMVYDKPACADCGQAAAARGLAEGPEVYREEQPRVIRYLTRDGVPHIEDADCKTVTLCGYACGRNARIDNPATDVCPACMEIADRYGYQPAPARKVSAHAAAIRDALTIYGYPADDATVTLVEELMSTNVNAFDHLTRAEFGRLARQAYCNARDLHAMKFLAPYCHLYGLPVPAWAA